MVKKTASSVSITSCFFHEKIKLIFLQSDVDWPTMTPQSCRHIKLLIHSRLQCYSSKNVIHRQNRELEKTVLGDRFREHFRDLEKDVKNASKPVARHLNLSSNSRQHMDGSLWSFPASTTGSTESRNLVPRGNMFGKAAKLGLGKKKK